MTDTPFDRFGEFAASAENLLEIAGRLSFQGDAEKYALQDVLKKLMLSPEDDLLDIGCGAGNLLIPMSFVAHSATGIDHANLLEKLTARLPVDSASMKLIPGNFMTTEVSGTFSKILMYSVVHYLRDEAELTTFIKKAAKLLRPGGTMLIGDIPNTDRKARFLASEEGKRFSAEWQKKIASAGAVNTPVPVNGPLIRIDDETVKRMITTLADAGMRAEVVTQPEALPISRTREDLMAVRK